jgi:putative restriction endonuclease
MPTANDSEASRLFLFCLRHIAITTWPGMIPMASRFLLRSLARICDAAVMATGPRVNWTRDQLLVALNLYCKLPFGQFHGRNPILIDVAKKMGRTANSLAMKLCNFASLDPVQQARGIKGLRGAAKQDKEMWDEFQAKLVELGPQSEQMVHDLITADKTKELDFLHRDRIRLEPTPPTEPTESKATVRVRRGQQFFRQAILNAYGVRCCISGINVPRLLIASHIKPWRDFPADRLNPRNGLCLSSIHDAAFDAGLITLDEKLRVVLSKRLRSYFPQPTLEQNFVPFDGQPIHLPEKLTEPDPDFLSFHREEVFAG